MRNLRLENKVVSILGAAGYGNMGQAIAKRCLEEGAIVYVAGRNADDLEKFVRQMEQAGYQGRVNKQLCDITKQAEINNTIDQIIKEYGQLNVAVNSTGWGLSAPFNKTTEEQLEHMMDVQFKGPFQWLQKLTQVMSEQQIGGSIIQISSATATTMVEHHAAYMGTKAGIDHVVRTVANEFGAKGIRANSISPGLTATPMVAKSMESEALTETFRKRYPLGRIGTAEDIAAAVVFLASDECFMSGENLQVNGGLLLRGNPSSKEIVQAMRDNGEIK